MADLGDSPTLNPMQGYGDATSYIPKTLGFDQRWLPILQLLQQQRQANAGPKPYPAHPLDPNDPNYDAVLDPHNSQYNPNDPRLVGGVSPYVTANGPPPQAPPLSGPQQSYANAATLQASNDGVSGQAGREESTYNNSPYRPGPQGTIGNTGQPAGPPQAGSQGELVGQGGQGWNIYQTTPTWTGSALSQSPPARDEGDFNLPPISGPHNPLAQRQAALRQQIIQQALANIPRGYRFKLG